jgi:RNA polymerase sigma-70 factor (ECF subfamily)
MSAAPRVQRATKTDGELVAAIAGGDLDALGELFDRHHAAVRRLAVRLGASEADADDLVQATFLEVVRAANGYDREHSVRTWLLGVTAMMMRRHRRSLARLAARLTTWASLPTSDGPATPDATFESEQAARRFDRAFRALSDKKREAFALVVLEGLSGEDAAAALGVPVNTIWTRLHHARRELKAALSGEDA